MSQQETTDTVQYIKNRSYDPTFDVETVELLGYDSDNNVLRRIVCDASGLVKIDPTNLDTRYLVKAGLSGGQTAYGGTGAGDDLTLHSTSHATKGNINLKDDTGLTSGKKIYFDV
jgi:hypothetical protein